jgi:hypothetical protein
MTSANLEQNDVDDEPRFTFTRLSSGFGAVYIRARRFLSPRIHSKTHARRLASQELVSSPSTHFHAMHHLMPISG